LLDEMTEIDVSQDHAVWVKCYFCCGKLQYCLK